MSVEINLSLEFPTCKSEVFKINLNTHFKTVSLGMNWVWTLNNQI